MKANSLVAASAALALVAVGAHAQTFTGQSISGVLGSNQTPGVTAQFISPITAPGNFSGVMNDVFGQTWDVSVDVLANSVVIGWTSGVDANIESSGNPITIDLSGYANGPILGLTSYSCLPAGSFACGAFGPGPSISGLSSTSSSFDVSFNTLRQGETYVFGLAVPEPASWALMLVGFAGLGIGLRRRRSVAHAA
jgi:hypothetical protein